MSGVFARGSKHYKKYLSMRLAGVRGLTDPWVLERKGIKARLKRICEYL